MRRGAVYAGVAGLVVASAVVLLAQAGQPTASPAVALPAPKVIFAKHVAALGGEKAFKAITSIHARGRFEIPAQGISGDLEVFSARPAKLLSRVTVPNIGRLENGFNGTVGWSLSPLSGPELMDGKQLSETKDDAWFDGALHGPEHVKSAETLARVDFDGHSAYKLHVVLVSGFEDTEYFDVDAGLQIGSESAHTTPQGVIAAVSFLREYRKFGAIMQPTKLVQHALGFEQVITITSYEYDTVPDATFQIPGEIRALIPQ
jgi:hypothetical protein